MAGSDRNALRDRSSNRRSRGQGRSPPSRPGSADGEARRVGRVSWWGRRVGNHHLRSGLQDVDFLKGANMAFRASAREPFDRLLRGDGAQVCNDLEATWSVRQRDWRVIHDPDVTVDHYPAPRHDDDTRDVRSTLAERAEEHNEVYALMRHAPPWQRVILLAYRLLDWQAGRTGPRARRDPPECPTTVVLGSLASRSPGSPH